MSSTELLLQLIVGFFVGALGQGLRAVVGIKKAQDDAVAQGKAFKDVFDNSRLVVSLSIGGMAGGLTLVSLSGFKPLSEIDANLFMKLIAIGYAGTDAIEGLLQKYLPSGVGSAASQINSVSQPVPAPSIPKTAANLLSASRMLFTNLQPNVPPQSPKDTLRSVVIRGCAVQVTSNHFVIDQNDPVGSLAKPIDWNNAAQQQAVMMARQINEEAQPTANYVSALYGMHPTISWAQAGLTDAELSGCATVGAVVDLVEGKYQ